VATRPCPNCGYELNESAIGCPDCGAKWTEAGEYLGVPAAYAGEEAPGSAARRLADMTRGELHATVFWAVFSAVLAAGFVWAVVGLLLGLIVSGD
jgi:hypothetical protein